MTSTTRYAWEISIHSTTRVETSLCIIPHGINTDFNPLHHEGGDLIKRYFPMYCNISIHSTTRVETFPLSVILPLFSQFQSTPPRGWRLGLRPCINHFPAISIHSTTRVETNALPLFVRNIHYFNPLHHEGGDLSASLIPFSTWNFNPLHHEGGDEPLLQNKKYLYIFQSTPPRGWRLWDCQCLPRPQKFQSTPPRGWRHYPVNQGCARQIDFNPLHHEGGDQVYHRQQHR